MTTRNWINFVKIKLSAFSGLIMIKAPTVWVLELQKTHYQWINKKNQNQGNDKARLYSYSKLIVTLCFFQSKLIIDLRYLLLTDNNSKNKQFGYDIVANHSDLNFCHFCTKTFKLTDLCMYLTPQWHIYKNSNVKEFFRYYNECF